ncbi:MAG: hypothetical protein ACJATN_002941 [Neolewinella sp.]|jgi:hypothetical protein
MKTLTLFLVGALLPVLLTAQSLVNPDFETSDGWLPIRLAQERFLGPSPDGDGQSLYLHPPFTNKESGYAYQEVAAPDAFLTQYQLRGRIRTRGVEGTGAYLYAYGKGEKSFLGYLQTTPLQNDNEWTEVKLRDAN